MGWIYSPEGLSSLGVFLAIIVIGVGYLDKRWSPPRSRGSISIEWDSLEVRLGLGVVSLMIGIIVGWFILGARSGTVATRHPQADPGHDPRPPENRTQT